LVCQKEESGKRTEERKNVIPVLYGKWKEDRGKKKCHSCPVCHSCGSRNPEDGSQRSEVGSQNCSGCITIPHLHAGVECSGRITIRREKL